MNFWRELQSLDESTKTKVLVVTTIVIMAIIIYFWLAYFNTLIAGVQPAQNTQTAQAGDGAQPAQPSLTETPEGAGVWQGAATAMGFMYAQFMSVMHSVGNIFEAPKQYNIAPN